MYEVKSRLFLAPVMLAAFLVAGPAWAFTATEVPKLTANDGAAGAYFGRSVAVDGDTAIVGAPLDGSAGSAYVFIRSGDTWAQQMKLTASEATPGAQFGGSVAVDGDTAVVGAWQDGTWGSAYVFTRSGDTWAQQRKFTGDEDSSFFGYSVAVDGDTAVIGAILDDHAASHAGAAYVFIRSGTEWTQQKRLTASDAASNDWFGYSVALDGDTAVIGALYDDDTDEGGTGNVNMGSAYVFIRSGTEWTQQAKLKTAGDDARPHDSFGASVAVTGDTAVIGAPGEPAFVDTGSAYVFIRSGTEWTQQAKLTASDAAANDGFGVFVAVAGDTAVVGAPAITNVGSAYVFIRSGTEWTQQAKLTASDGASTDAFGLSVALDGDAVVIGAYLDDDAGTDSGSAYVFSLANAPVGCQPASVAPETLSFGEVTIGVWSTLIVTVTNNDSAESLSLKEVGLTVGSSSDFAITMAPPLPATVAPGATIDVWLTYTPTAAGLANAELYLEWDCGGMGYAFQVPVTGTGNAAPVPPAQQIVNILALMDEAVAGGTLAGSGPGNAANGRLGALRNMIEAAGIMITNGQVAEACDQLQDALDRTDGASRPPDFVAGEAADDLAAAVQALRTDLGCS